MPEYAFAIDLYRTVGPEESWLYVQEYAAPAEIEEEAVRRRRGEVLASLPGVTGLPAERIKVRTRRRTPRGEQYRKVGEEGAFHTVLEDGLRLLVNFDDYLDTGLFLDHRLTRAAAAAGGRRAPLPESLRLHRNRDGVCGRGRRVEHCIGRHVPDVSGLGAAQPRAQHRGRRGAHARIHPGRLPGVAARRRARARALRPHLSRPADLLQLQAHAERARHRARPPRADRRLRAPARSAAGCSSSRPTPSASAWTRRSRERHAVRDISAATLPRDFERNPRIHRCFEIRAGLTVWRGNSFTGGRASGRVDGAYVPAEKTRKIILKKPPGGALVDRARAEQPENRESTRGPAGTAVGASFVLEYRSCSLVVQPARRRWLRSSAPPAPSASSSSAVSSRGASRSRSCACSPRRAPQARR